MKNKKIVISLFVILLILSASSFVYAACYSASGLYFDKGKSHKLEGNLGPEIYSTIKATQLIGTPEVNVKCQVKNGIFYSKGVSMDVRVTTLNANVYAIFKRNDPGVTRVTWKQTNDNASMIANITAYTN